MWRYLVAFAVAAFPLLAQTVDLDACNVTAPYTRCLRTDADNRFRCPAAPLVKGVYFLNIPHSLPPPYATKFFEGFAACARLKLCGLGSDDDAPQACGSDKESPRTWTQLLSSFPQACSAFQGQHDARVFDVLDGCATATNGTDKRIIDVVLIRHPLHRLLLQFLAERKVHNLSDDAYGATDQTHDGAGVLIPPHLLNLTQYAVRHANQVTRIVAGQPCAPATPACRSQRDAKAARIAYRRAALRNLRGVCVVLAYNRLYEGLMYLHQVLDRGVPDVRLVPPDYDQPPQQWERFESELARLRPYFTSDFVLFHAATQRSYHQLRSIF